MFDSHTLICTDGPPHARQGAYPADSCVPFDHAVSLWQLPPEPSDSDPWEHEQTAPRDPWGMADHGYVAIAVHPLDAAFPSPEGTLSHAERWLRECAMARHPAGSKRRSSTLADAMGWDGVTAPLFRP